MKSQKKHTKKRLTDDRKGALEGLPLYLVILVLITGVATTIMMGWLSQPENKTIGDVLVTPDKIILTGSGPYSNNHITLKVYVKDNDGNPVKGAVVTVKGMGIESSKGTTPSATTDNDGIAQFKGLEIKNALNDGELSVSIQKAGYGKKLVTVPVVIQA